MSILKIYYYIVDGQKIQIENKRRSKVSSKRNIHINFTSKIEDYVD